MQRGRMPQLVVTQLCNMVVQIRLQGVMPNIPNARSSVVFSDVCQFIFFIRESNMKSRTVFE